MNFSGENSFEIGIPKFMGVFDYGVYHSVTYSIMINGEPQGMITQTKGIR